MNSVADTMPPTITTANGRWVSEPMACDVAAGSRPKDASSAVIAKDRNRGLHFVDYVGKLAVGVKGEVPGPCSGIGLGEWRVVKGKRTLGAVKFVHERLVQAEVIHDGEAVVGR